MIYERYDIILDQCACIENTKHLTFKKQELERQWIILI